MNRIRRIAISLPNRVGAQPSAAKNELGLKVLSAMSDTVRTMRDRVGSRRIFAPGVRIVLVNGAGDGLR